MDCMCDHGTALQLLLCGFQVPGVNQNVIIYTLRGNSSFSYQVWRSELSNICALYEYELLEDTALESIH